MIIFNRYDLEMLERALREQINFLKFTYGEDSARFTVDVNCLITKLTRYREEIYGGGEIINPIKRPDEEIPRRE